MHRGKRTVAPILHTKNKARTTCHLSWLLGYPPNSLKYFPCTGQRLRRAGVAHGGFIDRWDFVNSIIFLLVSGLTSKPTSNQSVSEMLMLASRVYDEKNRVCWSPQNTGIAYFPEK